MSRFNIVMGVPDVERIGGYERQALKLTKSLLAHGCDVSVLSNQGQTARKIVKKVWDIPIDRITAKDTLYGYGSYQACISYLYRQLGKGIPLVVHSHAISDFTFTLLAAAQRLSIPTVLKLATQTDLIGLEKKHYYESRIYESGPKVLSILQQIDAIISLNENLTDEIQTYLKVHNRIKSYSNLIDTTRDLIVSSEHCRNVYADLKEKKLRYAIMTNRLERRKQALPLIKSWTRLPNEIKQRWRLVVIGDGEETVAIRNHLEKVSESTVILMGEQTGFLDLLNQADLFIFASEFEGNPNGLLEGLSRGLRVLATDIEGVGDCLPVTCQHSIFSLGKPSETRQAEGSILRALEAIEKGPERTEEEKQHIAHFCEESFGPGKMIGNYLRLYQQLTEIRRPASWRKWIASWQTKRPCTRQNPNQAHLQQQEDG